MGRGVMGGSGGFTAERTTPGFTTIRHSGALWPPPRRSCGKPLLGRNPTAVLIEVVGRWT